MLKVPNRHLKQDDAFNRMWWSVFSIDKLVTWQHLSIERTGGHVLLKAVVMLKVPNRHLKQDDAFSKTSFLFYPVRDKNQSSLIVGSKKTTPHAIV